MALSMKFEICLLVALIAYFIASKRVFDRVFSTSHTVIDELFHVPMGLAYCHRNFTYWDPKITTLPGLYMVSATFLGTYFDCNLYNLRFVNLATSVLNLALFASILKYVYGNNENQAKIVIQALNLSLLPPLYFFSHVYYTDTLSLMFLLAYSRLCFNNQHKLIILGLGACGVLVRQTNVVWIALVFGHKVLDIFIRSSRVYGNTYISNLTLSKSSFIAKDVDKSKLRRYYGLPDLFVALKYHVSTCFTTLFKFITLQDWLILIIHSTILISFLIFVYVNGSIVVGDKKAHTATLHLPQMLYFLLFYGVFGLPYVVAKISATLRLMYKNKLYVIVLSAVALLVVHYNTVVHPYLLADNRHYTFYVWNRWFGKYDYAVYATVPVYIFLFFSLYSNLKDQNCISFLLPFTVCAFAALALQKMVEIRYFLIPYIILRLRFVRPSFQIVLFELLWYILLNVVTFNLFFTKEIFWKDFDYAQRIIW
ncbi:putative Dol-P-Glc:Glc(2)Man(9)GlcNAc(2)-PP-Dol alpha-1,2-glucosyltransferase [Plutella xylostella]|uniref:putative Dol-P-Glc:Glc(2)Man(9)GlcNAc(2)-PP-Dol alpha-1,2-glucosyltransferase n=1 Tax=Plutella xylostella TaxID=51655 RepID=UPI002032B15A|nr:putative Dol-P-Glc:Glc(2)Man(9)GlcNAc(2)-PP-Dol alpha-1,2-glucosyltransferase [Plutella xylostella]